ncbi:LysR family transcriptional regulator [Mesobacterium pallidum]|uniref:LysR family transcriptional regulator n=1 Tax=Mesobacterium pallidum TaxID=2872037 RepID=UPI001EE329F4|nr:LysR family transcriptional regulator [Mesobacterium pallidum]
MPLSLRQLRAFLAVAEAESFTGAAERMNLTQSAVSMLVRQMEEDLRLPLFVRSGRGATLTEFGASIRPTAARVLADVDNIADAAADLRSLQRGQLRIAVPQLLGTCWLPDVLTRFRAAYPEVQVSVLEAAGDTVTDAVAQGEVEIGIGPERPIASGVSADFLWTVPMQLVVPASAAAEVGQAHSARDLRQMQWINYSDEYTAMLHRVLLGSPESARPQDMRVLGLMSAMAMIGRGTYVTVAPAYASLFADAFGVRFLPLEGPASRRRFLSYARARHDLSPAAAAFLEMARDAGPVGSDRDPEG